MSNDAMRKRMLKANARIDEAVAKEVDRRTTAQEAKRDDEEKERDKQWQRDMTWMPSEADHHSVRESGGKASPR